MSDATGLVGLVVAKAPVPGQAKTRLGATVGDHAAAELAAAALLDTLVVFEQTFGVESCALAWAGDLRRAARSDEIADHLGRWTVFEQRGESFAQRLLHAHQDTFDRFRVPVLQVGMDTPQLDARLLGSVAGPVLSDRSDAVLAPAYDGGWWALAVRTPQWVAGLETVEMSTERTADLTRALLTANGARVTMGPTLRDVDTAEDAGEVSALAPRTRFARCWQDLAGGAR